MKFISVFRHQQAARSIACLGLCTCMCFFALYALIYPIMGDFVLFGSERQSGGEQNSCFVLNKDDIYSVFLLEHMG